MTGDCMYGPFSYFISGGVPVVYIVCGVYSRLCGNCLVPFPVNVILPWRRKPRLEERLPEAFGS